MNLAMQLLSLFFPRIFNPAAPGAGLKKGRDRMPYKWLKAVWFKGHIVSTSSKDELPRGYSGAKLQRLAKKGNLTKCHA